ncbi:restriction endonuclease subunit S [Prosthecochloris ethylica]|nr:restriction endonuclease subunit S [Prosthecochloris ethylica]
MADNHIPKSWCLVRLGDFVENEKGKKPKNQQEKRDERYCYPYVDIEAFEDNVIKSYADGINCRFCSTDDFLMVWDGSRSGLVGKGIDGALGSTLIRINFPGIHNDYAYYFLQSKYLQINSRAKGSGTPHVDPDLLWNYSFPIPPLNEQHRIVAKIEELFSELDKGVESLKKAREQLKVYRQALLKHAFEGKLTEDWRKKNADKLETADQLLDRIKHEREARYQQQLEEWKSAVEQWEKDGKVGKRPSKQGKPKHLKSIGKDIQQTLPNLPDGWVWGKLGLMTTGVEYGSSTKSKKTGSHPVLRMGNIQNGKFDWSDLVYTSNEEEIRRYLLKKGDVLFNRTNSPELVGKTATYTESRPAVFAGYLIRINQINSIALSQYLNLFLNSHVAKQYGNIVKTDGVNQSNINGEKLINYPFPYCSTLEQKKILEILDEKLSVIDVFLDNIEENIARSEALRQSILKKAFSGQLVPQDPNDEPASVLLERIAREKAEVAVTAKKGRGPKKIIKQKAYEHL